MKDYLANPRLDGLGLVAISIALAALCAVLQFNPQVLLALRLHRGIHQDADQFRQVFQTLLADLLE